MEVYRATVVVGDPEGGFSTPALVEDEPTRPWEFGATYLVCDRLHDQGLALTAPSTGSLWASPWSGALVAAPSQVVAEGMTLGAGLWYPTDFQPSGHAVLVWVEHGGGSGSLLARTASGAGLGSSHALLTREGWNEHDLDMMLHAAASTSVDRALAVFTDDRGYSAARVHGGEIGTLNTIDSLSSPENRPRAWFLDGTEHAFLLYITTNGEVRAVVDDGETYSAPVTLGHAPGFQEAYGDVVLRLLSHPTEARGLIQFSGDAADGSAWAVASWDDGAFGAAESFASDPTTVTASGAWAGDGSHAWLAWETLDSAEGVHAYGRPWEGGLHSQRVRLDCDFKNQGIGDLSVLSTLSGDQTATRIGFLDGADEGFMLATTEGAEHQATVRYGLGEVAALAEGFLVVWSEGGELRWEDR